MFSSDDESAPSTFRSSKSNVLCFSKSVKSVDSYFSENMCSSCDETKARNADCELESDGDGFASSAAKFNLGSDAGCAIKAYDAVLSDDEVEIELSQAASGFTSVDTESDFNSYDASSDFASDDAKDFASDWSEDVESLADEFASLFGSTADDEDRPVEVEKVLQTTESPPLKLTSTAWQLSGSIADSVVRIFLNNPHEEVRKNGLAIAGAQNCEQLHVLVSNRLHELLKRAYHQRERKRMSNSTVQLKQEMPKSQHSITEAIK